MTHQSVNRAPTRELPTRAPTRELPLTCRLQTGMGLTASVHANAPLTLPIELPYLLQYWELHVAVRLTPLSSKHRADRVQVSLVLLYV
jgi:hypothetical protein